MDRLTIIIDDRVLSDTALDESALALRRELLELPVHDVQNLPSGIAPPGARVVDVTVIGGLVVMLNSSVALLASLVTAIRAWRRNTIPDSTVRLKIGDDEIEISGVSEETEELLLADWTRRHGNSP
jgi:hypothetical protein